MSTLFFGIFQKFEPPYCAIPKTHGMTQTVYVCPNLASQLCDWVAECTHGRHDKAFTTRSARVLGRRCRFIALYVLVVFAKTEMLLSRAAHKILNLLPEPGSCFVARWRHSAHRFFCASDIRFLASSLNVRPGPN